MSAADKQAAYQKGLWAEGLAAKFFRNKGYEVLAERYKTRFGEVDLIVRDAQETLLVFVEVKARKSEADALHAVTPASRKRIEQAALHFWAAHPEYAEYGLRFDVLGVCVNSAGGISVSHLDNAWMCDT